MLTPRKMSTNARFVVPGRPMNLAQVFLFDRLTEGRADQRALIVDTPDGVTTYTYGEIAALAAQYGHALAEQGLGLEDRVFIILEDGAEWVAAFFGALAVGCTVMFLNPNVGDEEIAFYLADSRAKGVVTTAEIGARLPSERPYLKAVHTVDTDVSAHPTTIEVAPTLEEDFAIWLYSSGSTGAPKAAVHRAYDFVYNTERYAKDVLQITDQDVTLSVPKLFFGYATGSNLLFPFFFGGAAILFPDRPTPERLFDMAERHGATVLINVPTMIAQMAAHHAAAESKPKTDTLRLLTSAGEALPPDLYQRWMNEVGVEILDGIGSAEMFHVFISARLGEVRPGSLGTIVEGYEAKIVDADGKEVEDGDMGALHIKGHSSAAFYWQRHEKSRTTLQGEWVVTSDQFIRDADGYYWFKGRADDVLKVAGRWLSPQEIEDALTRHDAVLEAGAAAYQDDGLNKPMAFVILRDGFTADDALKKALSQHVADTLAPYKAPRFIEVVDTLPRGDRDKLDRKALATLAAEAAARR